MAILRSRSSLGGESLSPASTQHDRSNPAAVAGELAKTRDHRANVACMSDMQPKRLTDYANCAG